jgi:hypothetical protein
MPVESQRELRALFCSNMIKNLEYAKHIFRKKAKTRYTHMMILIDVTYHTPKRRNRSI